MNYKPTLVMTVGIPRAGKSTWCRTQDAPIVNPDSIRMALHGKPFIPEAEDHVWAIAKTMVRALFIAGHQKVILDATLTRVSKRADWRSPLWKREFVVFQAKAEECQRIALEGNREYLVPVIERMENERQDIQQIELDGEDTVRYELGAGYREEK